MLPATLRRLCEFQLYALVFALPFEYYFGSPQQSLLSSLKLQIALLAASWISLKAVEFCEKGRDIRISLKGSLPGRILYSIAAFALVQVLAAICAPALRVNAGRAAAKSVLGAFLAVLAADLYCRLGSSPGSVAKCTFPAPKEHQVTHGNNRLSPLPGLSSMQYPTRRLTSPAIRFGLSGARRDPPLDGFATDTGLGACGRDPRLYSLLTLSITATCTSLLGLGELSGIGFCSRIAHMFQSSQYFSGNRLRFVSTMEYPNTAGSILSASLCATLALAISPESSKGGTVRRRILLAMAAVQGLALAYTYSRGALASTVLAIIVATWVLRRHLREKHSRIAAATGLAFLTVAAPLSYFARHDVEAGIPHAQMRTARYGMEANEEIKVLLSNHVYQETVEVQNDSTATWRRGEWGIAYRWHSVSAGQTSPLQIGAEFTSDIAPMHGAKLQVSLNTPSRDGEYLLIWLVFRRDGETRVLTGSYSPAVLCLVGQARGGGLSDLSGQARRYLEAIREERRNLSGALIPQRSELWHAALRMFYSRPFLGFGPDSFRILKWKYMDLPKGDETILSNNLYLELLSGSGLLGLISFLWLAWEFGKCVAAGTTTSPASLVATYFGVAYLTGLLSHGFVDYFLKFTPTFLLFWLSLGLSCAKEAGTERGNGANRI